MRSDVSGGASRQPLAFVSVLLVDSAPIPGSTVSASKVVHQEATASASHIDWNFGNDSDEKKCIFWAEEGEDYRCEGDEVCP